MVVRVFLSLAVLASLATASQPLYAQDSEKCEGTGIYRPFTPVRKFQVAAAYFVNPALWKKAEVIEVYSVAKLVEIVKNNQNKDIVEKFSKSGFEKAQFWIPIANGAREFTKTGLTSGCIPTDHEIGISGKKVDVHAVLKSLKPDTYVSFAPLFKIDEKVPLKSKEFVAWNPEKKVEIAGQPSGS